MNYVGATVELIRHIVAAVEETRGQGVRSQERIIGAIFKSLVEWKIFKKRNRIE